MDSPDEKLLQAVDRTLRPLEQHSHRPAVILAEGDITRVLLTPSGGRAHLWIVAIAIVVIVIPTATAAFLGELSLSLVMVAVVVLVMAGVLSSEQSIVISSTEVCLHRRVGPFRRSRRIPISTIREVHAEVFSFANWDPHLAVVTDRGVKRIAWTVSPDVAHQIADAIQRRLSSNT